MLKETYVSYPHFVRKLSAEDCPTINIQDLPSDKTREWAGEKEDRIGYLFGLTDAAKWYYIPDLLSFDRIGKGRPRHIRLDPSWCDAIDPNALRC